MVFNPNSYNYSNDLSRIANSLGRAMFGSAADDAAIARGKYYDAQTASTEQDTAQKRMQNTARNALIAQPGFQNVIAKAMGLDTLSPGFMGPPSSSQIRTGTPTAQNLAQTFLGTGGNAQQMANAANLFGEGGANRLAESMILGGSDKQAQRGALLKAPQGGQFQNPGFATQKLRTDDATARRDDDLDYDAEIKRDRLRFGVGGQGDRDTEAQEATKVENNKRDQATVRYKHDNRTIDLKVEPGKQIVVDPTTARKLGIPKINDPDSQYNGLHVLDGGRKPGDVVVKVGREDVFMDEATAKAIGAEKNEDGQYVIKGAGYEKDASTRGSSGGDGGEEDALDLTRYNTEWRDTVKFYPDFENVPNHAESAMKRMITAQIKRDMKPESAGGRGMTYTEAYAANADIMVGAGAYEVTTGSNFFVPKYYFDGFATGGQRNLPQGAIVNFFRSNLGYSQDQAKRVAEEIIAARG